MQTILKARFKTYKFTRWTWRVQKEKESVHQNGCLGVQPRGATVTCIASCCRCYKYSSVSKIPSLLNFHTNAEGEGDIEMGEKEGECPSSGLGADGGKALQLEQGQAWWVSGDRTEGYDAERLAYGEGDGPV